MPKVSVIIPTFNRANYLAIAIQSVLGQSYSDLELIIVDNASTDETENVIDKLAHDKRIKYIRNSTNIGPNRNHILALSKVTGEYVAVFSDDDIMLQDYIKKKNNVLDNFNNVVVVHSSLNTIDSNGNIIDTNHWAKDTYKKYQITSGITEKEIIRNILLNEWNFISFPSAMVRSSTIFENQITFNPFLKYIVDWEFWLVLCNYGDIYYLDEALINYRRHVSNETNLISAEIAFIELVIMKITYLYKYGVFAPIDFSAVLNDTAKQVKKTYGAEVLYKDKNSILEKIYYLLK